MAAVSAVAVREFAVVIERHSKKLGGCGDAAVWGEVARDEFVSGLPEDHPAPLLCKPVHSWDLSSFFESRETLVPLKKPGHSDFFLRLSREEVVRDNPQVFARARAAAWATGGCSAEEAISAAVDVKEVATEELLPLVSLVVSPLASPHQIVGALQIIIDVVHNTTAGFKNDVAELIGFARLGRMLARTPSPDADERIASCVAVLVARLVHDNESLAVRLLPSVQGPLLALALGDPRSGAVANALTAIANLVHMAPESDWTSVMGSVDALDRMALDGSEAQRAAAMNVFSSLLHLDLPSAVFAKGLTVAIRCLKDSPPDAQVCRHALNFLRAALRSRYHSETKQVASDQGLLSTTASIAQRTSDRAIFDRANGVLEALGGTPSGPRSHLPLVQAGEPQTQLDKMTALLTNRISLLVVSCPALTNIYPARHCGRYGDDWHFAAFFDSMHQQVTWCAASAVFEHIDCLDEHEVQQGDARILNEVLRSPIVQDWIGGDIGIEAVTASGTRWKDGTPEQCPCIVVYVRNKGVLPLGCKELPRAVSFGGLQFPLDVRSGVFSFHLGDTFVRRRFNDIIPGCEIGKVGHPSAFSVGAFVQSRTDGVRGIITAGHPWWEHPDEETRESLVEHPSSLLENEDESKKTFLKLRTCAGPVPPQWTSNVDCAFLELLDQSDRPVDCNQMLSAFPGKIAGQALRSFRANQGAAVLASKGQLTGFLPFAQLDTLVAPNRPLSVFKVGRSSGITPGHISQFSATVVRRNSFVFPVDLVKARPKDATLVNQIKVDKIPGESPFSQEGDSGSLVWMIVSDAVVAVGIVVGGVDGGGFSVVTPIDSVLEALNVDLITPAQATTTTAPPAAAPSATGL